MRQDDGEQRSASCLSPGARGMRILTSLGNISNQTVVDLWDALAKISVCTATSSPRRRRKNWKGVATFMEGEAEWKFGVPSRQSRRVLRSRQTFRCRKSIYVP